MTLNELVDNIYEHNQVFLTGAGGTGKSYVLRQLINQYDRLLLLGTTNLSALNINGQTVHSAFALSVAKNVEEIEVKDEEQIRFIANVNGMTFKKARDRFYDNLKTMLQDIDIIVIDEVSMLSAEVLQMIYFRLGQAKITNPKFLFVGDFYQLPPVSTPDNKQTPVWKSKYWSPKIIEITDIKRTDDKEFAEIQKEIREGVWSEAGVSLFKSMYNRELEDFRPIHLVSTNKRADLINLRALEALDGKEYSFPVQIDYDNTNGKALSDLSIDRCLNIKVGAKVLFTQTIKDAGIYKGAMGVVKSCNGSMIRVEVNGGYYDVGYMTFEKTAVSFASTKPKTITECSGKYVPLKLAYAITIHRSQGMSLDEVEIDCAGIFIPSQFYVALSRAKNPDKCVIKNYKKSHWIDEEVKSYLDGAEIERVKEIRC